MQRLRGKCCVVLMLAAALWVWGCSHTHPQEEAAQESESIADTVWNQHFELFMEYPPIRVGEAADFLAHLTDLPGRRPVTEGPVDFRFTRRGQAVQTVRADQPLRPGIFRIQAQFDSPGPLELVIEIGGGAQQGEIQASPLTVFGPDEKLPDSGEQSGEASIPFLKEQQWTLDFAIAQAGVQRLSETVNAPASILPVSGRDTLVRSPAEGVYRAPPGGSPRLAQRVSRGQLVGWIDLTPDRRSGIGGDQIQASLGLLQLQREMAQAEAAVAQESQLLEQAKRQTARLERLLAAEAVPPKRVEEARSDLAVRRSALQAAQQVRSLLAEQQDRIGAQSRDVQQLKQRIPLHSPISGRVAEASVADGAVVDPRQHLFRILDLHKVWIRAEVAESESHLLGNLQGATLELGGRQQPLQIAPQSLVSVSSVVDPASRTVAVVWEAANPEGLLKAGMLAQIHMRTGGEREALAVPSSAVLIEDNKSVVYLQLEGESFSRRIVTTGIQDRGWVEIVEGLKAGQLVVVEGAYEVALAARAGESGAAHGHAH